MIGRGELMGSNITLPDTHEVYKDIRESIDEIDLDRLDELKTAYRLAKEPVNGLLSIILAEGYTRERIEALYEAGGKYLEGKAKNCLSDGALKTYIDTPLGKFTTTVLCPIANIVVNQSFVLLLDTAYVTKNCGSSGTSVVITGLSDYRTPLTTSVTGELATNLLHTCIESEKQLQHNRKTFSDCNKFMYPNWVIQEYVEKHCPHIINKGKDYINLPLEYSVFSTYIGELQSSVKRAINKEKIVIGGTFVYLSINTITSEVTVYV